MAKLIYSMIASLDGYVADESGGFGWAAPAEDVHQFINDLTRSVGTYLFGRRMYEVMAVWEAMPGLADEPPVIRDFARIWQSADKVVYSTTLASAPTSRTRIERDFDAQVIRAMKAELTQDITVGGPQLAAAAMSAGLVDEVHLFVAPVLVGGGTRVWPAGGRLPLELLDQRRFASGFAHLHYRTLA